MTGAVQADAKAVPVPLPDANFDQVIRSGLWILGAGFGGFLLWATFAPLDEGVPAPGTVSVASKRKRIDHLNGGIVEKILVREGERVRAGQPLIELNQTQARAALKAAQSQWRMSLATEARLSAERDRRKTIDFPAALTSARADPEVAAAMRAQGELFRSRRSALEGELSIVRESIRGLEMQIRSLEELQKGRAMQVALFNEQFASFRKLNADGFISRNQLIETERQLAEVQTKQSEDYANLAGVKARLAEFSMRGAQREIEYRREVETQLAEVQKDAATLGERHTSQRDVHERLVLGAPVAGTVVDLAFHTIGGVIKAGDRIMDIVPEDDELIVEAQVPTQYIDRVRVGLPADVHFDAYINRVAQPVVSGRVVVVSADAMSDARTGAQYYALRVSVPGTELKKLGEVKLKPGMQATVMVKTGERSLLAYLARPLLRRFHTALAEF